VEKPLERLSESDLAREAIDAPVSEEVIELFLFFSEKISKILNFERNHSLK